MTPDYPAALENTLTALVAAAEQAVRQGGTGDNGRQALGDLALAAHRARLLLAAKKILKEEGQ